MKTRTEAPVKKDRLPDLVKEQANVVQLMAPRTAPGNGPATGTALAPQFNGDHPNGAGGVSVVTPQRVAYQKITRFNPLRRLKAERLSQEIDSFHQGRLRELALLFDAIENRDDVLKSVIPKREAAIKKLGYQIVKMPNIDTEQEAEADAHVEALQYFYDNLTCTHATKPDIKGGFATFASLAMKAVGHYWAPFEILWDPTPEGLTATFNYVPLWFFEATEGRLKFLPFEHALYGDDLLKNGWVIFSGVGLLEPCAVCFLVKDLSRTSWLIYSQNLGMPGTVGKTTAAYLSDQWNALYDMLGSVVAGGVMLMGEGDSIEKLDLSATGQLPFSELYREQNERMATMWRGGPLGTIASGQGPEQKGVPLQQDEETKLACSDGSDISETLNQKVDPIVIEWAFGEGVKPLAYIKIAPPLSVDVQREMMVDDHLTKHGVKIGKRQMMEQYSRTAPAEDDEPVELQQQGGLEGLGEPGAGLGQPPFGNKEPTEQEILELVESSNESMAETLTRLNADPRNARAIQAVLTSGKLSQKGQV